MAERDFAYLAKKISVLSPSPRISVNSSQGTITLNATWHRWIDTINFLTIGLFMFAPIFIIYFVLPEVFSNTPELVSTANKIAFFSIPFFLTAFYLLGRYGKISWQTDSSEFTLNYGYFPFSRKQVFSKKGLLVKMYLYNADRHNLQIKYGCTILSLIRSQHPQDELIIAAVKDRKNIEHAFHVLEKFLGEGIDETSPKETHSTSVDFPFDNESLDWNKLAKKSRTKTPFFTSLRGRSIAIKSTTQGVVFKWRWTWYLPLLFLLPTCGFMYFSAFFLFEPNIHGIFFLEVIPKPSEGG